MKDILENMGVKNAQEDFLAGKNGAIQLTEADLKVLDDLSSEISKKNASSDNTSGENVSITFSKYIKPCFIAFTKLYSRYTNKIY